MIADDFWEEVTDLGKPIEDPELRDIGLRAGRFYIHHKNIRAEACRPLWEGIVPIRAWFIEDEAAFLVMALSEKFEPIEPGTEAPMYTAFIRNGELRFEVRK